MPATLCKAMYFSAVMKMPSSWGSCTSRSHPHFSHASDIHWAGSELVVMTASFQNRSSSPLWRARPCKRVMANLRIALRAAEADPPDVVKTTVYVASQRREDLLAAWEVVRRHFGDHDAPSAA